METRVCMQILINIPFHHDSHIPKKMRAGPLLKGVWYLRNIYYLFKNLNLLYNSLFNEAQVSVLLMYEQVMFIVLRSIGSLERRCRINVFSQRNVIRKTLQASPSSVTYKIKTSDLYRDNLLVAELNIYITKLCENWKAHFLFSFLFPFFVPS